MTSFNAQIQDCYQQLVKETIEILAANYQFDTKDALQLFKQATNVKDFKDVKNVKDYVIAIPTYNRAKELTKKTLTTLQNGSVCAERIYIFVANEEQKQWYQATVPQTMYGKIVVGELGIANQRNFISTYFPEHQYIVSMDDDIEKVERMVSSDTLTPIQNLHEFFEDAFAQLTSEQLHIWGVYPVHNAYFMKHTVTTHLAFLIGVMYGYINRHDAELRPSPRAESKEDYELSILYYKKDGGVMRFNDVVPKTKFNAVGGLGKDRFERNLNAAQYLQDTYPDMVTMFYRKKNKTPEVKISRKKKFARTKSVNEKKGNITVYHVEKQISDENMVKLKNTYVKPSQIKLILNHDADVYTSDNKLLLKYRKNKLSSSKIDEFYKAIIDFASNDTSNRGMTSGSEKNNVKDNPRIKSNIFGYFDKFGPSQNALLRNNGIDNILRVRETRFTMDYPEKYKHTLPLIREIDENYKKYIPLNYKLQRKKANQTHFRITNTSFTTVTTNVNFQTTIHRDTGDDSEGFGNLVVIEQGKYKGAEICFPQYGVGVDLRSKDVLFMDVHQWHGNLPMKKIDKDAIRLSVVCYLRYNVWAKSKGKSKAFMVKHVNALKNLRKSSNNKTKKTKNNNNKTKKNNKN